MEVIDGTTREIRKAEIFVAVLGASNYTFADATWTQSLPDWIAVPRSSGNVLAHSASRRSRKRSLGSVNRTSSIPTKGWP
jgi:transposase